jgi:ABC-type sugar transport system permease subunit
MVQIGIGGFSHPEMIRVAFRIAARRVILTILGPFFTLLFGIDSGEWLRFAGVFVTFFFLFGAIVSPIITLAMATYLRHAGASADELARVPGSLFPRFLYFAGLGVALVIASFVWHWAVRPIAKIVSDVLVYLGDFPIPTATLVAGDESTTSFKN